jgi:hypothetical protein
MIGLANMWGTGNCETIIEIADLAILFAQKLILGHSQYCSYYYFNQSASFMHQQWHNISRIPIIVSIPITHSFQGYLLMFLFGFDTLVLLFIMVMPNQELGDNQEYQENSRSVSGPHLCNVWCCKEYRGYQSE